MYIVRLKGDTEAIATERSYLDAWRQARAYTERNEIGMEDMEIEAVSEMDAALASEAGISLRQQGDTVEVTFVV